MSGNYNKEFYISQNGELKTAQRFQQIKEVSNFQLVIRCYDNGHPPLYTDTTVNIVIIPESKYSPEVLPLSIKLFVLPEEIINYELGKVTATDGDPYDDLVYGIQPIEKFVQQTTFYIDKNKGTLTAQGHIKQGSYKLNISVSDGKYMKFKRIDVQVTELSGEILKNA
ncbi:unnamed protein product, partial [Meganyctiphanes norvegica]